MIRTPPCALFRREAVILLALLAGGCASSGPRSSGTFDPRLYAWPTDEPRVGLVRIVQRYRDAARGWLRDDKDAPLFVRPYAAAWDGDALVVTDPGAAAVLRLGADRRLTTSREGLFEGPIGVAVCPAGIVVTDGPAGTVALLDQRLRLVRWLARGLARPTGVVCLDGVVYVVETAAHRLLRLDPAVEDGQGEATGGRGSAPGQFNYPAALAADRDALWVGDTLNFRVQHLAPDRANGTVEVFGQLGDAAGETPRIKGIAVDPEDRLWISDAHLDQVALYTREGVYLMSLGRSGNAPGEFSFPTGIAVRPDGRVAVVDSMNRRLQVFQLLAAPVDATPETKEDNR